MLERWQLAGPDLINNTAYPRVGQNISFGKSDALGRPDVLDKLVS
jgi:hypothetical protein